MRKIILFVLTFLMILFSADLISAASGFYSSYQMQPNYQTYYAGRVSVYWPQVASVEDCKARQDFILQTGIAGCEPMVVRSDLLAEQNVPVFCQIEALQINPLLNIKSIDNIRFVGSYPKEVAGVGFHPARAALRTRETLLNSPLINNIGYAVIILKRNPVEKNLSDYVEVNLTGQIEYEAGNAIGIGRTEFLLEEVSDAKWESEKTKYGFWNGRYFLRLLGSDANNAYLGVYQGDLKIGEIKAELGKSANTFYLPGYYCQAGLDAYFSGYVSGVKRARIEVTSDDGTNSYVVTEGTTFDNGRCKVYKVEAGKTPGTGKVSLNCRGVGNFALELKLRDSSFVRELKTPDGKVLIPKQYSKDNRVYWYVELKQDVGLIKKGFYGINISNKLFFGESLDKLDKVVVNEKEDVGNEYKSNEGWYKQLRNILLEISRIGEKSDKAEESRIFFDIPLPNEDAEKAFNEAIEAYLKVARDYPAERKSEVEGSDLYGEIALKRALELAREPKIIGYKKETEIKILKELIEKYPNSKEIESYKEQLNRLIVFSDENAVFNGKIDGKFRIIRLVDVFELIKKPNADFSINNLIVNLEQEEFSGNRSFIGKTISDNEIRMDSSKTAKKITHLRLNKVISSEEVEVGVYCRVAAQRGATIELKKTKTMKLGTSGEELCEGSGENIRLEKVEMAKVAKVILTPKVAGTTTQTNLTIKIGIEKRAIKLSPDRKREAIKSLNKTINDFEKISEKLGKVVTAMKSVCFATSSALILKNTILGFSGGAMAREQTMSGKNGWIERCRAMSGPGNKYYSLTQCLNANEADINREIEMRKKTLNEVNNEIKNIENSPGITTKKNIFAGGDSVDSQRASQLLLEKLKKEFPNDQRVEALKGMDEKGRVAYSYNELRDLYYNLKLEKAGIRSAKEEANSIANRIRDEQEILNRIRESEKRKGLLADFGVSKTSITNIVKTKFFRIEGNKIGGLDVSGCCLLY
ncbi:MAG: hypothetical protein N3D20_01225, partial [Candidatus Pacearchaeota archaeon]|nr:hypothetical protein [Candidatus Pacearchaeota archaeon]